MDYDNTGYSGYEDEERIIGRSKQFDDRDEKTLRPITFEDYSGQSKVKDNLKIFICSRSFSNVSFLLKTKCSYKSKHIGKIICCKIKKAKEKSACMRRPFLS